MYWVKKISLIFGVKKKTLIFGVKKITLVSKLYHLQEDSQSTSCRVPDFCQNIPGTLETVWPMLII